ncbi:putative MFS efflux transporter [Aspergillus undulatus]|uniref:putative MFS efflux transporter n=1 Tax=Aspergillus undulatus TaxID=1810928 RepID=UPI003CCD602C
MAELEGRIGPEGSPRTTPNPHLRVFGRREINIYMTSGVKLLSSSKLVPGALLPYIERYYSINYAVVSLIFVTNAVGFITAAPLTDYLEQKLGRGYIVIVCTLPYSLVVLAFFLIGLGEALDLALNNVFCANYGNGTTALGFLHGAYGLGGTVGPLIGTAIASSGVPWSRFYSVALGIVVINASFAGWAFWSYEKPNSSPPTTAPITAPATPAPTPTLTFPQSQSTRRLLLSALKAPVTALGALFIFAYQGAEVSISSRVFLETTRSADLSSIGYVTAGFWGGITVGRLVISHLAFRLGEKTCVAAFVLGSLAFQPVLWFVPSIVGNAVAVAIIGLLLGPVYPCAMAVFSRALPRDLQLTSLGVVSSAGSSGGAVAPLATGLVSRKTGVWVLHPICVGLYGVMLGAWVCLPRGKKRDE